MESYGAFGKAATHVLKALRLQAANAALAIPVAEFAANALRILAVALQKGNGMVAKRGAGWARAPVSERPAGRKRQQRDVEAHDD